MAISLKTIFTVAVFVSYCFFCALAFQPDASIAQKIAAMKTGEHNPYREINLFFNGLFYDFTGLKFIADMAVEKFGSEGGYYFQTYIRDFCAGTSLYWLTAGIWHVIIYHVYGDQLFTQKGLAFPTWDTMIDQMQLAQASLFMYTAFPVFSEYLIENNFTKTYYYIDEVGGWGFYWLYMIIYFALVEVGIYWVHRTLHENKFLYKYVHGLHHKYNKRSTMTPWCSIAFNPIDGCLQASPYVAMLFVVPVHYFTHLFLFFFSAVWATNIHDSLWGDTEPIMGSKYHTMHHTHYHYNFGQVFIFSDIIFGSYKAPEKSVKDE